MEISFADEEFARSLNNVLRILAIVLPIVLSWFIRTFVKSSSMETEMAAVVKLTNAAINYAEDLDKRGDLDLPPDVSKGARKLDIATEWLDSELERTGVKMTTEEAKKWVAAEFQERISNVRMPSNVAEWVQQAIDWVLTLEENEVVTIPSDEERISVLTDLAADFVMTQFAKRGTQVSREDVVPLVRTELLDRSGAGGGTASLGDGRLSDLAQKALDFLKDLEGEEGLSLRTDASNGDVEYDVVVAWLVTQAAKEGLSVTTEEIAEAADEALRRYQAERDESTLPRLPG